MNGLAGTGLKSLPHDARPREKLLARGPSALSDAELLALLLRTGIPGKHVVQLAQELLNAFGGVGGLLHTGAEALKVIKGLGPAKRAEVVAVLELARRALAQELQQKALFDSPKAVREYLQLQLGARNHEVFAVLFLDSQNRLIALEELFRGTLTQTSVYPREVVLRALHHHAAAVMPGTPIHRIHHPEPPSEHHVPSPRRFLSHPALPHVRSAGPGDHRHL